MMFYHEWRYPLSGRADDDLIGTMPFSKPCRTACTHPCGYLNINGSSYCCEENKDHSCDVIVDDQGVCYCGRHKKDSERF
jgi:hypothetical protein